MKNKTYILIAAIAGSTLLSSCSDWFDISPKTDVKAEEFFDTENGFMSALTGTYLLMTNEESYGADLSFALADQLAQMYDMVPEGAIDRNSIYNYTQSTNGGYNTKGRLERIWLSSYNIIANANNLLKWLDKKGEEVLPDENKRNMIRGEALAIRAFIHFDLLRYWGPVNYAGNPDIRSTKCMPYRTVADKSKKPLLPASDIVAKIITDLEAAKECLAYEENLDLSAYNIEGDRRFRFNYHAVNATLARVHNYAGNSSEAKRLALDVIDNCGLDLKNSNDNDPILFGETLCGISVYQMLDNYTTYFDASDKIQTKYHITFATLGRIFEISGSESDDMRARSAAITRNNDRQMAITNKYIDNDNEVIPLIRLPEMYYIVCENSEGDEASYHINHVRNRRGISSSNDVSCDTPEKRIKALNSEYRKEFYAEGQYFHFLKSHGLTGELYHCPEVSLTNENFIFPLPDAEKEYGWTNEEEDTTEDEESNEETSTDNL